MLTESLLKTYRLQGFLVAPKEDETQFLKRIEICTAQEEVLSVDAANPILEELFSITFASIPGKVSNKGLAPWHGAMTWVHEKEGISLPFIQVRKKVWGYTSSEILSHELVHYARAAFPPSRFEEVFAYATSSKKWRRKVGPLFRNTYDAPIFLSFTVLLNAACILDLFKIPAFCLFSLYGAFLIGRTVKDFIQLKKCQKTLFKLFPHCNARSIALQLTDEEIELFATKSLKVIKLYIKSQACLRWRQIKNFTGSSPVYLDSVIGKKGVDYEARSEYGRSARAGTCDDASSQAGPSYSDTSYSRTYRADSRGNRKKPSSRIKCLFESRKK